MPGGGPERAGGGCGGRVGGIGRPNGGAGGAGGGGGQLNARGGAADGGPGGLEALGGAAKGVVEHPKPGPAGQEEDPGNSELDRSEERRVGKECRSRWAP